jgi:hypothetical protein
MGSQTEFGNQENVVVDENTGYLQPVAPSRYQRSEAELL